MNPKLKEINELIDLCDKMLEQIAKIGDIQKGNTTYLEYKDKVDTFCKKYHINNIEYGPYAILSKFYFISNYTLNTSEVCSIRDALVKIKHTYFKEDFEKIFISHREKDKKQVEAFVNLLYAIGIPRPTEENPESIIFCTSHPNGYISNGDKNLETIRNMINTDKHVFYILWYTDNYFQSQACLNEAGAIWVMKKKYQEILMPEFDKNKIIGLLDKQPVWFRANDKFRLNDFAADIQKMFSLPILTQSSWELARDEFIKHIEEFNK